MLWGVCLHRLCARASLKVSCLCGSPSPHLTVSPMGSRGCAWLPHLPSPFILAACEVFIIPEWSRKLTQSQVVVCDSGLLFWKVRRIQHSGVICYQAKFFCWLRMQNFLCGQNRGMTGGSVASTHSSFGPRLFFSGTIALSQNLGWHQELTKTQDLRWNFLLLQRNTVCWVALTYEGSVLGSLGKITLHEPLLRLHDTDSCTWFHSLFTKSSSDFRFITPTVQIRKSSIEKKFAWSHLTFSELIGTNILNHYVYYLFIYSNSINKNLLFMIDRWDKP